MFIGIIFVASLVLPTRVFGFQCLPPHVSLYTNVKQLGAFKNNGCCRSMVRKHRPKVMPEPPELQPVPFVMPLVTMSLLVASTISSPAMAFSTTSLTTALAGPIPSAFMAYTHFVGLIGVSGSLVAERLLLKKGMTEAEEIIMYNADGIYGLSALVMLVSGYFRATDFAKGWEFYQHEPIFWLKLSSLAIMGGLSFFPTIVLFRRDQARRAGKNLTPLSDGIVDRMTTIINAELLALLTIPLLASLMARGVWYVDDFPWSLGAALCAVSLGGAGFKYGKEAFAMMESEGSLLEESTPSP